MTTRFVPVHVRSAIDIVKTDHERTTTERDAFAKFADCLSDLDVSSVDLHPDHPHQAPVQTLVASETPAHPDSPLACVRDAYRDTVMGVPHYEEDYGDSLPESSPRSSDPKSPPQSPPTISSRLFSETNSSRRLTKLARVDTLSYRA